MKYFHKSCDEKNTTYIIIFNDLFDSRMFRIDNAISNEANIHGAEIFSRLPKRGGALAQRMKNPNSPHY